MTKMTFLPFEKKPLQIFYILPSLLVYALSKAMPKKMGHCSSFLTASKMIQYIRVAFRMRMANNRCLSKSNIFIREVSNPHI